MDLAQPEQAEGQLGAARAQQAGDAQDLALAKVEADVVELAVPGQVVHLQHRLLGDVGGHKVVVLQLAAGHVIGEILLGQLGSGAGVHVFAVAHDAHVVGDLKDLLGLVADEHDGDARIPQLAHRLEQRVHLLLGQGGGGLVHDDQLGVEQQRPADGHQLLVRHRQIAHLGVQIDLVADLREGLLCGLLPALAVHDLSVGRDLAVDGQVFHDRQVGEDGQILVDDLYAQACGLRGGDVLYGLALEQHLALVAGVHAGDDLHQRGFAAPVFAGQAHDLAGPDREIDVVQGVDAAEALVNTGHLKQVFRHDALLLVFLDS